MSDSQLNGDPARQDIVRLIPALRAFARTFCRNPSDADDLVQETLMKALANLDKFERGTRLKSWLFTIMRNTFYTRSKILGREAPGVEENVSGDTPIAASQEMAARAREVQRALQKLPPHYREVLTLVAILGESYEATAVICDCAVGTVKSRLNRARHQILQELGEEAG
ncbi:MULTISPECIES: sigma-70 family RNA polymerase sigma factor [Rhizobium]|uniref:RNA polymerase sigma factor n=1 Tax=Rhizobium wenxiniae TaxID=1737357 RepID=A0A7W9Y454_9HYPH|nr:sigma-70 family RNA polymerase sigma factor [Rhizobium wenxiniae]MBB6161655.1 RNA polymerase sigma-70 factor (ECF subfamily) [Rhizobium wenxiniae]GGF90534.1 DNA-directed RNA polymerase sigma-70 factor [Rhizobium wenxiniae]